jgi:hypothetical protein
VQLEEKQVGIRGGILHAGKVLPWKGAGSLRHQQQVEVRLNVGHEFGSRGDGNPPVVRKQKVVIQVALATQPEMLNVNLGPYPTGRAYHSAISKIMKFLAALRIHTL